MKRRYTRWIFEASYAQRTGIKVGFIYNKTDGNPEDVICVQICGLKETIEFNCRLDEAVILAAGLNKVAGQMLVGQLSEGLSSMAITPQGG